MISFSIRSIARFSFVAVMVSLLAGSALAADPPKKKKDKDQSDAARDAIKKQQEIAKGLKDKASVEDLQKQVDAIKADIAAENARHAKELADLQAASTASAADPKEVEKNAKAIKKENEQYADKIASLNKKLANAQAKLDAAKS